MITINNFTHRLGNQMFQIAAAFAYAKRNNVKFFLPKEWSYQKYFKLNHLVRDLSGTEYIYREKGFHYEPIPDFMHNVAMEGYFQSEKYFQDINIFDLFDFSEEVKIKDNLLSLLYSYEWCSLHVRRGDYINLPKHHPLMSVDYYLNAIKYVPVNNFMVFSDDIQWCKNNLGNISNLNPDYAKYEFVFVETGSDISDLKLMSMCHHNIVANSTFSWWGAMLNKNPYKIVVCPNTQDWHGSAYSHWDHSDLLPKKWYQLPQYLIS